MRLISSQVQENWGNSPHENVIIKFLKNNSFEHRSTTIEYKATHKSTAHTQTHTNSHKLSVMPMITVIFHIQHQFPNILHSPLLIIIKSLQAHPVHAIVCGSVADVLDFFFTVCSIYPWFSARKMRWCGLLFRVFIGTTQQNWNASMESACVSYPKCHVGYKTLNRGCMSQYTTHVFLQTQHNNVCHSLYIATRHMYHSSIQYTSMQRVT